MIADRKGREARIEGHHASLGDPVRCSTPSKRRTNGQRPARAGSDRRHFQHEWAGSLLGQQEAQGHDAPGIHRAPLPARPARTRWPRTGPAGRPPRATRPRGSALAPGTRRPRLPRRVEVELVLTPVATHAGHERIARLQAERPGPGIAPRRSHRCSPARSDPENSSGCRSVMPESAVGHPAHDAVVHGLRLCGRVGRCERKQRNLWGLGHR